MKSRELMGMGMRLVMMRKRYTSHDSKGSLAMRLVLPLGLQPPFEARSTEEMLLLTLNPDG